MASHIETPNSLRVYFLVGMMHDLLKLLHYERPLHNRADGSATW